MSFASVSPPLASPRRWMVREPHQKGVLPYRLTGSSSGCPGRGVGPSNLASQLRLHFLSGPLSQRAPSTFQGQVGTRKRPEHG